MSRQRTAGRSPVEVVIQQLTLIEATADATSYLASMEAIDRARVAIREAARAARIELELAFGLEWLPEFGGPRRRDGSLIAERSKGSAENRKGAH